MTTSFYYQKNEILEPINNKGNNKVFKLISNNSCFLLKKYNLDDRERLLREVEFYKYTNDNLIANTPKLIKYCLDNKYIITSFEHNQKSVSSDDIEEDFILQYAIFINNLNSNPNKLKSYKFKARESFESVSLYIKNLDAIFDRYCLYLKNYPEDIKNLLYDIQKYYLQIKNNLSSRNITIIKKTILSPSDVGFHNTFINNNKLIFYDFEYAGLDNPLKLVSDFFLQPRYRINKKNISFFIKNLDFINDDFLKQFKIVLPLFVIKWILIFFNFLDPNNINKFYYSNFDEIIKNRVNLIKNYLLFFESNYEIY